MFRPLASSVRRTPTRRGALLIAVLGLLTLFAIFALFFVFYADAEATGARIAREAETDGETGPPNDYAVAAYNATLSSLIFDTYDVGGVLNPLRGHSLARSMYSWNGSIPIQANAPFFGIGTFHETAPHGVDRAAWINFSAPFTTNAGPMLPAGNYTYFLDPEWNQYRLNTELGAAPGTIAGRPQAHVPKNAPYTYPDLKDLILASVSPATGEVLVPSLHRHWLFNANNTVNNGAYRLAPWNPSDNPMAAGYRGLDLNTDWVTPEGRTRILRPRPIDQLTANDFSTAPGGPLPYPLVPGLSNYSGAQLTALFNLINARIAAGQVIAYPHFNADGTYTGDVQNLMGPVGVQRNDSILIDIGLPPRKWNNRWIKPLASILLTDLDGLLNLNAHGNMRGGAATAPAYDRGYHWSYNGFGPHEVNLRAVLGTTGEAENVVQGRYGIPQWLPASMGGAYSEGSVVVNGGNFYRCVAPSGPIVPSGSEPGPTGSYPTFATAYNDGASVRWVNMSYGARPWTPIFGYNPGDIVVNNNRYYITSDTGTSGTVGPSGSPFNDNGITWIDLPPNLFGRVGLARNIVSNNNSMRLGRTVIPQYAGVNFDAGGNGGTVSPPLTFGAGGNAFRTNAMFANTGSQSSFNDISTPDTYDKSLNHPLLFNTHDWPTGVAGRRLFGFGDLKRFNIRYAADRDYYLQTEVARTNVPGTTSPVASSSLVGTTGAGNNYRLDQSHYNRGLFTTFSSTLDRPYQVSNFGTSMAGTFSLAAGQFHPINGAFAGQMSPGGGSDYISPNDLRNPRAALGGIDLNRPLTDYRNNTATPLHPNNMGNAAQAWVDRHNLARDILGRLILATGANATVITAVTPTGVPAYPTYYPGDIVINAAVGGADYNAIRYLAQLAANMVDLTDSDDVSTLFAWDIGAAGIPAAQIPPRTITQVNTTNHGSVVTAAVGQSPAGFVCGVEKPRLVLNEAYSEAVNDPNEPNGKGKGKGLLAMRDGGIRFWVELMNPTSPAYAGAGPIGTAASAGATQVRYEAADGLPMGTAPYSPYRLEMARAERAGTIGYAYLNQPQNVKGDFGAANGTAYAPDVRYDFTDAGANRVVGPNNGTHTPGNNPLTSGILLVGPNIAPGQVIAAGQEFDPKTTNAGTWANMIEATYTPAFGMNPTTGMEYRLIPADLNAVNPKNTTSDFRRNIILLRRLANPYQPESATNPYITVDYMDHVYMNDAIHTGMGGIAGGGETITDRFSTGKVQPYAGHCIPDPNGGMAGLPSYSFPRTGPNGGSFVLRQNPNPANTTEPQHTFGRHNGTAAAGPGAQTYTNGPMPGANMPGETLMAPFDWFVHYDRPLVNQLELLSLQATKPHEVTQHSIFNNAGTLVRNRGLAPFLGFNTTTGQPGFDTTTNRTNNGLFRALESLRVKPWMHGVGFGGKQHGRINLNMVQDPRILTALFDPQTGNVFDATHVNQVWTGQAGMPGTPGLFTNVPGAPLAGARTVNSQDRPLANGGTVRVPFPGPSYDDVPDPLNPAPAFFNTFAPYDRPFRALGAAEFAPGPAPAARGGSGLQDTILRVNPATGAPLIRLPSSVTTQPYQQDEMARKMFNNTTTVSHAFGVTITIVFHEVRMNGLNMEVMNEGAGNRFLVGKEAYKDIPGDLRQQFYAVVDRASIGLVPSSTALQTQPFTTEFSGQLDPAPSPPPAGYQAHLPGTYNLYLSNAIPLASAIPHRRNGFTTHSTTFYMDGRPITIGGNYAGPIVVGTGTNQEVMTMNYVNEDGSINVNRSSTLIVHAAGEVVASFVPGNPGPNPLPGVPFDSLSPATPYRAIVPYAQRVR